MMPALTMSGMIERSSGDEVSSGSPAQKPLQKSKPQEHSSSPSSSWFGGYSAGSAACSDEVIELCEDDRDVVRYFEVSLSSWFGEYSVGSTS